MDISYISCSYDIEDKLSLTLLEPVDFRPVALCHIDARDQLLYSLPTSLTIQSQICRFAQEALHAQLHLLRHKSTLLRWEHIEHALSLTIKQLEFFLKNHGWQAQVHALLIIPDVLFHSSKDNNRYCDQFTLVSVGQPCVLSFDHKKTELRGLINHEELNCYPLGSSYSLSFQRHHFNLNDSNRLIVASPSWQQLRPSRILDLFNAPWIELPQLMSEMIGNNEIDRNPFSVVQLSPAHNKLWHSFYNLQTKLHKSFINLLSQDSN
jgi:hypothetical protein